MPRRPDLSPHARRLLARELWPDKVLYASVLVVVAGAAGAAYAAGAPVLGIAYDAGVPAWARMEPWSWSARLAVLALVLGLVALATRRNLWAGLGAAAAALSVGPLGVSVLLALPALGFVLLAARERESAHHATRNLPARAWPDKSLAAALLLVLLGVACALWGAALLAGAVAIAGVPPLFGTSSAAVGLLCVLAAVLVQRQRAWAMGVAAAALAIPTVAFGIVGPGVGVATLVLLGLARREGEFR